MNTDPMGHTWRYCVSRHGLLRGTLSAAHLWLLGCRVPEWWRI